MENKVQPSTAKTQPRKTIALQSLEVIGPSRFGEHIEDSIGDMTRS